MSVPSFTYLRGAFVAYEPGTYDDLKKMKKRIIPFRFNPESISRTIALEAAKSGDGNEGAARKTPAKQAGTGKADPGAGALKESFSIRIRLDFDDRGGGAANFDPTLGIAPEIAAIEDLLHPAPSDTQKAAGKSKPPQQPLSERPTVLFVWGRARVLPVRIASLKIEESVYNAELFPVRAEIEASLEVLGAIEAKGHLGVRAALAHTESKRKEFARQYYRNTADTGPTLPWEEAT